MADLDRGLTRLAEAIDPVAGDAVVAGAATHRARRRRRRRATVAGVGVLTVGLLAGTAVAVSRVDEPGDRVVTEPPTGVDLPDAPERAIALAGDDEAVWVLTERHLVRVGAAAEAVAEVGPVDLLAVGDAGVWLANEDGRLRLVDPDDLSVDLDVDLDDGPVAMATLGDRVWVRLRTGLVAVDPSGEMATSELELASAGPIAVQGRRVWLGVGGDLLGVDARGRWVDTVRLTDLGLSRMTSISEIVPSGDRFWLVTQNPVANPGRSIAVVEPAPERRLVFSDATLTATPRGEGGDVWVADGSELYRYAPDATGPQDFTPEGSVGLGFATVAGDRYWYLSSDTQVVAAGAAPITVVDDPERRPGPTGDCPAADHGLRVTGDGLPPAGSTRPAVVADVLAESHDELLAAYGAVDARVVPRNGYAWRRTGEQSDFALAFVDVVDWVALRDDQIEVVLPSAEQCPAAPVLWNGVPLVFTVQTGG